MESEERDKIFDEAAERFAHIVVQQIQEDHSKKKESQDTKEELNP
jgi:hypothetical protein